MEATLSGDIDDHMSVLTCGGRDEPGAWARPRKWIGTILQDAKVVEAMEKRVVREEVTLHFGDAAPNPGPGDPPMLCSRNLSTAEMAARVKKFLTTGREGRRVSTETDGEVVYGVVQSFEALVPPQAAPCQTASATASKGRSRAVR
jgi:hypothetical protein